MEFIERKISMYTVCTTSLTPTPTLTRCPGREHEGEDFSSMSLLISISIHIGGVGENGTAWRYLAIGVYI
jgi:hypothetical protein